MRGTNSSRVCHVNNVPHPARLRLYGHFHGTEEEHGLFTMHFLKAMEGEADIDRDNVVTGTELGAYLRPTVSNASKQAQTPLYGRLEGEGEFLFFVLKQEE